MKDYQKELLEQRHKNAEKDKETERLKVNMLAIIQSGYLVITITWNTYQLIYTCIKPFSLNVDQIKLQSVDRSKLARGRESVPTIVTYYQNVLLVVQFLTGIKPNMMLKPYVMYIKVYT